MALRWLERIQCRSGYIYATMCEFRGSRKSSASLMSFWMMSLFTVYCACGQVMWS